LGYFFVEFAQEEKVVRISFLIRHTIARKKIAEEEDEKAIIKGQFSSVELRCYQCECLRTGDA
jgi:hypothetical protein